MRTNVATVAPAEIAAAVRLMLVTDDRLVGGRDLVQLAAAAERGGATTVQLRLKLAPAREQVMLARALVAALRIPVLVNDRLDVALAAGAAGVHLGPADLPPGLARKVAPPGFIIGASVGSDAEIGAGLDADYWGVGPWRTTETKPEAGPPLGAAGFEALARRAAGRPCIAIGGVEPSDVGTVVAVGGAGVAVVSGILAQVDIEAATKAYANAYADAYARANPAVH